MPIRLPKAPYFPPDGPALHIFRPHHHKTVRLHAHEFSELVIVHSGRGIHFTETDRHPVTAGDVYVMIGDMVHGYDDVEDLILTNILFLPDRLRMPVRDLRAMPGYHALFTLEPKYRSAQKFTARLHLNAEEMARLETWLDELERALKVREPGYQFVSLTLFMMMVVFLSSSYGRSRSASSRYLLRIAKVISHIEQHFAESISLEKLAAVAHLSRSNLTRCFRLAMDISPIEYLIKLRVRKAAELLRGSDVKILGVAFAVGFTDGNYFARQFRQIMGLSPKEYRRLAQLPSEH
jgi:AraC family L-rhamnose operon transcriptional activator RhaR/AraC family L-rhamnose operon regulatory protein RhaS